MHNDKKEFASCVVEPFYTEPMEWLSFIRLNNIACALMNLILACKQGIQAILSAPVLLNHVI